MTRCRRKRTIPEAAYAFSIIRDHPYYDANRRTGLMAALVFLGLNGCGNHKYHEPLLQEAVFYLADQKLTRVEFADYLRHAYDGGLREPGGALNTRTKDWRYAFVADEVPDRSQLTTGPLIAMAQTYR